MRYTAQNGLPGGRVMDICQDSAGQFWFATDGGLGCYAPDRQGPDTFLEMPPLEIAPYQNVLFKFSGRDALKRTPSEQLKFSWRLDSGVWSAYGSDDQILLSELDPGAHTLSVRGMDLELNVDPIPEFHTFIVLAPVWRRGWFIGLCLVSVVAVSVSVGYAFQRHRRWREAQTRLIDELESELQQAHRMQMGLLPKDPIRNEHMEIAGVCAPANHVGGDYYTYFWFDEDEQLLGFGAADVSGKAMEAAVRAMQLSGIFRFEFKGARPPMEVAANLDRDLKEQLDETSFVTCCLGTLNITDGCVELVNSAHPFPYHYCAAKKTLSALEMPSLPLGLILPPGSPGGRSETSLDMSPGDLLVLYSDGVTDMQDESGEFYEEERLEHMIREHVLSDVDTLANAVLNDLRRFKGGRPQADDITLLVIRYVGGKKREG
jgi:serine phosphatase RsbU (regulator of sigma subunit)